MVQHRELYVKFAVLYESAYISDHTMRALAERMNDNLIRTRLTILSSFCRAHSQRLMFRMLALSSNRVVVPALPEEYVLGQDVISELKREAANASMHCAYYVEVAKLARQSADISSTGVCELNRAEEMDRARELRYLIDKLRGAKVA